MTRLAPWTAAQLQTLLTQRGHAWLLCGPSGLGQFELAMALARAWLCDQPSAQGACGRCVSCHAIDVQTHADLAVLMPETALLAQGWPLGDKAKDEIESKKRKPSKEIRVEALRDVVEFAQRTSARAQGKVVLIYPAERMNLISANTLLKTLEEPVGNVRFVLASEAVHLLLPTIRSRCLTHTMTWPDTAQALAWLVEQGLSEAQARVSLQAAGARVHDALLFAQLGSTWQRVPRAVAQGDLALFRDWSPAELLDALHKLCHDLLVVKAGAAPRFFAAADLPAGASWQALSDWGRALQQARRTVEHPFAAALMQEALISQAQHALSATA